MNWPQVIKRRVLRRYLGVIQSRTFKYFMNHMYDTFHDIVDNNLQLWENNGLMERAAVAIEEKIGSRYGRTYAGFIDCLERDRPEGGLSDPGTNSRQWLQIFSVPFIMCGNQSKV
jgi:hypothetical protein